MKPELVSFLQYRMVEESSGTRSRSMNILNKLQKEIYLKHTAPYPYYL